MTRELTTILDGEWNADNVTKPAIVESPYISYRVYQRGVVVKRSKKLEDYVGIISRTNYTIDSHDLWQVWVVSHDEDDCIAMIDEIRRICAAFDPTATEKILAWEGGNWELHVPYRFVFAFVIAVRKPGMEIG